MSLLSAQSKKKDQKKKENRKIYEKMDLDKFKDFADGEDFLARPVDADLRCTGPQAVAVEVLRSVPKDDGKSMLISI